jgi:LysM repeat protein
MVQAGDTLYSIARRFGVSIWQLATTNAIPNINLIFVGQVLIIPGGGGTPPPAPGPSPIPTRYVVQAGDTLYSIARQFGVNVWQLAQFNNLMNPNLIYAGQVLMIPVPAPAPTQ